MSEIVDLDDLLCTADVLFDYLPAVDYTYGIAAQALPAVDAQVRIPGIGGVFKVQNINRNPDDIRQFLLDCGGTANNDVGLAVVGEYQRSLRR